MVELQAYLDADLALTEAMESDSRVMRHLGGRSAPEAIVDAHRRRLADPWWFKIVAEPAGPGVGTIGVWETTHHDASVWETGWMVLPEHQGRGIATMALGLLIERVKAEPRFDSLHAFPGVDNPASNALCRRFGFELLEQESFEFRGHTLHCNHWRLETPAD